MQFLFSLVWVLPFFIGGNLAAGFVTQLVPPPTPPSPPCSACPYSTLPCLIKNKSCKANNAPAIKKESPKERKKKNRQKTSNNNNEEEEEEEEENVKYTRKRYRFI